MADQSNNTVPRIVTISPSVSQGVLGSLNAGQTLTANFKNDQAGRFVALAMMGGVEFAADVANVAKAGQPWLRQGYHQSAANLQSLIPHESDIKVLIKAGSVSVTDDWVPFSDLITREGANWLARVFAFENLVAWTFSFRNDNPTYAARVHLTLIGEQQGIQNVIGA